MPSASNWAGGLDAIRDAINMYMGLRQTRIENQRADDATGRANRQLALDEQRQRLNEDIYRQDRATRSLSEDRDAAQFYIQNYPGPVEDPATTALINRSGYGGAMTPETTLPGRRMAGAMMGGPEDLQTTAIPTTPTGRMSIRPTSSERSRIAYDNTLAAQGRFNTQQAGINQRFSQTMDFRRQQLAQNTDIRQAEQALRQRGLNISADQLALAISRANMNVDDTNFANKLAAARLQLQSQRGPEAFLAALGVSAGDLEPIDIPTPPTLPYFPPPSAAPAAPPTSPYGRFDPVR